MAWYASVAKVGHSTSGLTTTITFRVTQRVDGNSYDAVGWDVRWNASTGASGPLRFAINKNQTVTRDFSVSVGHNSSTGIAPNVTVTVSNLREGNYINSVVSKSASFQPPKVNVTKVPPQVSNVKLTRNSDSQLTINWTNNGSGNTAPNHNYVDIKTDDGSWVCIHNGGTKTSHVWTGASKGHKYQARVNSGNSAGHNTHVESNIVYTAPESLKEFSDGRVIVVDTNQNLSVNFDSSNVKYTSNKIEMQYSNDNSVWRGINGTIDSVYTFNNAVGSSLSLTNKEMDSTLKSYISALDDSGKLYLRARIYNTDNSLTSSWSDSTLVKLSKQPMVQFYLPDEEVYYIYKTEPLPNGTIYTAKIPKKLLDGGKKILGRNLAVLFGFYMGAARTGPRVVSPGVEIGTAFKTLVFVKDSEAYTKERLDQLNFGWVDTDVWADNYDRTYTWEMSLSDEDLKLIAPSSTQIKVQIPDIPVKKFTIQIEGQSEPTIITIPTTINTTEPFNGDTKDVVNRLSWIIKKGKYVSGPTNIFYDDIQCSSYSGGRFYVAGYAANDGHVYVSPTEVISNDTVKFRIERSISSSEWYRASIGPGNYQAFEEAHKSELPIIKDPTVYIKI